LLFCAWLPVYRLPFPPTNTPLWIMNQKREHLHRRLLIQRLSRPLHPPQQPPPLSNLLLRSKQPRFVFLILLEPLFTPVCSLSHMTALALVLL
jgi:hypothetical protein